MFTYSTKLSKCLKILSVAVTPNTTNQNTPDYEQKRKIEELSRIHRRSTFRYNFEAPQQDFSNQSSKIFCMNTLFLVAFEIRFSYYFFCILLGTCTRLLIASAVYASRDYPGSHRFMKSRDQYQNESLKIKIFPLLSLQQYKN